MSIDINTKKKSYIHLGPVIWLITETLTCYNSVSIHVDEQKPNQSRHKAAECQLLKKIQSLLFQCNHVPDIEENAVTCVFHATMCQILTKMQSLVFQCNHVPDIHKHSSSHHDATRCQILKKIHSLDLKCNQVPDIEESPLARYKLQPGARLWRKSTRST